MATAPTDSIRTTYPVPDYIDNFVLAGAAKTVTYPTWARLARVSVSDLCYLRRTGTAIVPIADTGSGGGAPALGAGSWPIHPTQDVEFNLAGALSFSIIGTAVVAVAYFRDAGSLT